MVINNQQPKKLILVTSYTAPFLVAMILICFIACDSSEKMETQYHPNGQVKFEVPLKGKNWHGEAKGYFPNGKLQGKMTFVNGNREGLAYEYYESGKIKATTFFYHDIVLKEELWSSSGALVEKTVFDSTGNPVDFYRFRVDGSRDFSYRVPIVYLLDTAWVGKPVTLIAKVGNMDTTRLDEGYMLITSNIENGKPVDTLFYQKSTNQERFQYRFVPDAAGEAVIKGGLIFKGQQPVMFEYGFKVYDPSSDR